MSFSKANCDAARYDPGDSRPTDAVHDIVVRLEAIERKIDNMSRAAGGRERRYESLRRAASGADLSVPSLRRLIDSGKLRAHRPVPGKILIDRRELEALIAASTVKRRGGRGRQQKY
jgi:hypothetical protein